MSGSARWVWLAAVSCVACAARQPAPRTAAAISSRADLSGVWVEYWAPVGKANSQRFAFLADGQFAWQAAVSGQPPAGSQRKQGHFQVERAGEDGTLVLSVASDEQRSEVEAAPRRIDYAPERLERLELGECAPNIEAQALDARYACVSIGGRAFWRQPGAPAEAQALLWAAPVTPPLPAAAAP